MAMPAAKSCSATSEIVVVTGSSGCLGQRTVELLISRDDKVREIRCLDWVVPAESMKRTIEAELDKIEERLGLRKVIRYVRGDIRDINVVEQLLSGADCVIHCAAKVDFWTDAAQQDALELESINICGTENLLKSCVRQGVGKFVHVSSFEVFASYHTIYYATESTIPEPKYLLFGASGATKKEAELKVRQYSNVKLKNVNQTTATATATTSLRLAATDTNKPTTTSASEAIKTSSSSLIEHKREKRDSLSAVIVRFTPIYGEHDKYYVSKILKLTKFFGGKLQRFTNIWIRQQPIYVGNAAWSLIKAKQRMDVDESISGEEFHITDDTPIGDPFDFMEPFVEAHGMKVSKSTFPAWPVWLLIVLFTFMRNSLISLDVFGLFTNKKSRLDEAIEMDKKREQQQQHLTLNNGGDAVMDPSDDTERRSLSSKVKTTRWYHLITSQTFYFMCNSLFLNRTKASLRLDYEPIFDPRESLERSLNWYKNHLEL